MPQIKLLIKIDPIRTEVEALAHFNQFRKKHT